MSAEHHFGGPPDLLLRARKRWQSRATTHGVVRPPSPRERPPPDVQNIQMFRFTAGLDLSPKKNQQPKQEEPVRVTSGTGESLVCDLGRGEREVSEETGVVQEMFYKKNA